MPGLGSGAMKRYVVLVALVSLAACRKNPHVSKSEIGQATHLNISKIILQKKYQLDNTASLEDITLFEADNKTNIAIFTPSEKNYSLMRHYAWPELLVEPKLFFISIGNKRSHILLTYGAAEKTIQIIDAENFSQVFSPASFETKTVKITKNEEKPQDEILSLGSSAYRFNGMKWVSYIPEDIFPYVDTFQVSGENSLIEITNRGQFGTRVIITLAFPDVNAANLNEKLKTTKNIPTVHLYRPGFSAHRSGGGKVSLPHPIIEIHKESWPKNGRIKLPLYMKDIKKFTLRAVYSQRGHNIEWPIGTGPGLTKDAQNYPAVENR
jgi:hypothetical protein